MKEVFSKLITSDEELRPRSYFWLIILVLFILFSSAILFLNKDEGISSVSNVTGAVEKDRTARIYSVYYKNGTFSPTNIRIKSGDTVRFENSGMFPLRIVSDDLDGFDSMGEIPSKGVFSYTFASTGIFIYYSLDKPEEAGKVIVRN